MPHERVHAHALEVERIDQCRDIVRHHLGRVLVGPRAGAVSPLIDYQDAVLVREGRRDAKRKCSEVLHAQGDAATAVAHLEDVLPVWRELAARPGFAHALTALADAALAAGDPRRAARALDEAIPLYGGQAAERIEVQQHPYQRRLPGRVRLVLTGIAITALGAQTAYAQDNDPGAQELDVGVYISPPFVERTGENTYSGMAIELWETIAERMGIDYRYVGYPTGRDLVEATANGEVDAAVTNLTITQDRAQAIAFTQPWYDGGLRIMVSGQAGGGLRGFMAGLADAGHLRVYVWILLLVLFATVAVTLFDRRFDAEFPKRWSAGLAESFYNVMSIVTTGKAPHKNLFGWVGRIIAGTWLAVGIAVVAYIISSLTSVMTTLSLTQSIHSLSDLPGHTVAVRAGSIAQDYMRQFGVASRPYPGIDESVEALEAGDVDAIVGDAPILEHYAHTNTDRDVAVVGRVFHADKYGFAFPQDSELTNRVTLQILELREAGTIEDLRRKYFGQAH